MRCLNPVDTLSKFVENLKDITHNLSQLLHSWITPCQSLSDVDFHIRNKTLNRCTNCRFLHALYSSWQKAGEETGDVVTILPCCLCACLSDEGTYRSEIWGWLTCMDV